MSGLTVIVITVAIVLSVVSSGIIIGKKEYDNGFDEGAKATKKIYGIDKSLNPKECRTCGNVFSIDKRYMYITKEDEVTGLSTLGTKKEPKLYEAIDCPKCGCQNLLGVRLRGVGKYKDVVEHYEEEKEIEVMDLSKD